MFCVYVNDGCVMRRMLPGIESNTVSKCGSGRDRTNVIEQDL